MKLIHRIRFETIVLKAYCFNIGCESNITGRLYRLKRLNVVLGTGNQRDKIKLS